MSEQRRIIRWEAPPPTKYGKGRGRRPQGDGRDQWETVAADLRAQPGEWAVIAEMENNGPVSTLTSAIKRGATPAWEPAGAFDAAMRKQGDLTVVYAVYLAGPAGQ